MTTRCLADVHVSGQIEEFLAGSLDSGAETEFETHLLACDSCFAEYMARTLPEI